MMSPESIAQQNAEATMRAMEEQRQPFVFISFQEVDLLSSFPFPVLGDFIPQGWELLEEFFVDKTGIGEEDEPAMTQDIFRNKIKEVCWEYGIENVGWGLGKEGQFQIFVRAYTRTD